MKRKTIFSLIIFFLICLIFFLFKGSNNKKTQKIETDISNDVSYHSNIIKDVYYSSKDIRGNEYIIRASEGEIDFNNPNISIIIFGQIAHIFFSFYKFKLLDTSYD